MSMYQIARTRCGESSPVAAVISFIQKTFERVVNQISFYKYKTKLQWREWTFGAFHLQFKYLYSQPVLPFNIHVNLLCLQIPAWGTLYIDSYCTTALFYSVQYTKPFAEYACTLITNIQWHLYLVFTPNPSGLLFFLSILPLLLHIALPGCLPSREWLRINIRVFRPQRPVLETKACSMKGGLRNKIFYSWNWFRIHVALRLTLLLPHSPPLQDLS